MNNPNKIITHTAVSSKAQTTEDVDLWHKPRWAGFTSTQFKNKRGEFYHVGYHFVIHWDGTWVQTRGLTEEGAHCIGANRSSIGVCFMGNGDLHEPSERQLHAWQEIYDYITSRYPNITTQDIYPHRKYANKTCHGSLLSDTYYADRLNTDDKKAFMKAQIRSLQMQLIKLYSLLINKRMSQRERYNK